MTNVVLNIPKEHCKEVEIKGMPFIQVDIGLTPEELISILVKWVSNDKPLAAVIKRGAKNETDN